MDNKKVVIVVGAGSTYADGMFMPQYKRPPLNQGFFRQCKKSKSPQVAKLFETVQRTLKSLYNIDILASNNDYLENTLVKVYVDALSEGGSRQQELENLFRHLIRLLNLQMADVTQYLKAGHSSGVRKLISQFIKQGIALKNICLITFNYDLNIEKNLQNLSELNMFASQKEHIFNFPYLYELGKSIPITGPGKPGNTFTVSNKKEDKIILLKLHGSLNWYSKHQSRSPSLTALFQPNRELHITSRMNVDPAMKHKFKKKLATYPVVIPPIVGKAAIFHWRIKELWMIARNRLKTASEVVIYGYSFPATDYESVNLLENTVGQNKNCSCVSVINPDASVITRMGTIPQNKPVTMFPNVDSFLSHL